MSYTAYLATRYLFGKHRIPFIAFISRTTMIGMALGVSTLLLALSVMHGFESVVTTKIIGFDTHIRIEKLFESGMDLSPEKLEAIRAIPGVELLFPIKKAEVMLKANDITEGALLEAMPQSALTHLYSVSSNIQANTTLSEGILMGKALAEQLQILPGQALLLYQLGAPDLVMGLPAVARATLGSIYESGMIDYDKSYMYCDLETMDALFPNAAASDDYGIFLSDLSFTEGVVQQIDEILPYSHLSVSWRDRHHTLFSWMKTQQLPIFVIFSLIMAVALVNISSTLILIIMEKRSEIGTLRALGTSKRRIRRIFALEGLLMGITGSLAGLLLTLLLAWLQTRFGLISLPSDVYFMDKVTIMLAPWDILSIGLGTVLLATLSSLFPAMQASNVKPADALRDE